MNATQKRGSDRDAGESRSFATRNALFCDLSRTQDELASAIKTARWQITAVDNIDSATKTLYDTAFEVGVIVISVGLSLIHI